MAPTLAVLTASGEAADWLAGNRDTVSGVVADHGAVLIRGLDVRDAAGAAAVSTTLTGGLMTEREGFAPRDLLDGGVYSSSKWPPDQPMCMHHELSYALDFPGTMVFTCLKAPARGGVTAVADARAVLAGLPPELADRFERTGWQLLRNYNPLVGVSWTDAFQTEDRAEVERYCKANLIAYAWTDDGGLRTRQHRSAVVRHPVTGERCWFNQIAFLNEWTMEADVREFLKMEFGDAGVPFNTLFGDGTPLDEDIVKQINDVYDRHTAREPWQAGDVLVVDNIRTSHSREPYTGDREVVVAMGNPVRLDACSPSVEVRPLDA